MGVNCGAKLAKYILFAFNIIIFIGGAAVLGVGIWLKVDSPSFTQALGQLDPTAQAQTVANNILTDSQYWISVVAWLLIGVGAVVLVIGFMGCCGACKEWRPLLVGYAICLIIIMIIELGVGIAVGVYKDEVVGKLEKNFGALEFEPKYRLIQVTAGPDGQLSVQQPAMPDGHRMITNTINALQVSLGCCGLRRTASGPAWEIYRKPNTQYYQDGGRAPPVFCCAFRNPAMLVLENPRCAVERTVSGTQANFITEGCFDKIEAYVNQYAPAVIGVAVGIGLIELIGVFFSFCLCCAIGDKKRYG